MALKNLAEKDCVLITDGLTDLLYGAVVALQQVLGSGNAQFLQVNKRAVPGSLLKTANECAGSCPPSGRGLGREGPFKIRVHPLLRGRDSFIGMLGL